MTSDLLYKPLTELGKLIRSRKLSPVELTTQYIQRAKEFDPQLFAFVTFTESLAMDQARTAEREAAKGKFRGPLHEPAFTASRGDTRVSGAAAVVRHYPTDDSIFIDEDYLIKGVAGAIFWKLLSDYNRDKRTEFTNRELRLDSKLGLPDITDNLEARLILLQRRLAERRAPHRIEKTGRGRFRLEVSRPFTLVEM